jgi:hypothetical protein
MGGLAHDQFAKDHGCEPTVVRERPELLTADESAPTFAHSGYRAYEVIGCQSHDLEICESGGYLPGGVYSGPVCNPEPMCDPGPSCTTDYQASAHAMFVKDNSCPSERITTALTAPVLPKPPPEIASDPARTNIWMQDQVNNFERIRGLHWVTAKGCSAEALYSCKKRAPSAPACTRADAASQLAMQAGNEGDINARMEAPDVFKLALHSPPPPLPPAMQHLRAAAKAVASDAISAPACEPLIDQLIAQAGWQLTPANAPSDVTLQVQCMKLAMVNHGGHLFVLLPLQQGRVSVLAPSGELVDELPVLPATMACPSDDEPTCDAAVGEYITAATMGALGNSQKLTDFLKRH